MRSPLKKLLAVVVPMFAALSLSAAPASATGIATQSCPKSNQMFVPASGSQEYQAADANGDGWVCVQAHGNGRWHLTDDIVSLTTLP